MFYELLGCPHASDYTADTFLVANPVVLEALWSGGELGRHGLYPRCPKNRQQIKSRLVQLRQKVQLVTKPDRLTVGVTRLWDLFLTPIYSCTNTAVLARGVCRLTMQALLQRLSRIPFSARQPGMTVIVSDTDGAWRMADGIGWMEVSETQRFQR